MFRYGFAAFVTAAALLLVSCAPDEGASATNPPAQSTQTPAATPQPNAAPNDATLALAAQNAEANLAKTIEADIEHAKQVVLDGSLMISEGGAYLIRGTLENGMIYVDAGQSDVWLVLDGVSVTNASGPALWVKQAKHTYVVLNPGSVNSFSDGGADTEHNAAIYSQDDIWIGGDGTLNVSGNHDNGIASKDDLMILGGTINVKAVDDALAGRDSVIITGGALTLDAGGDGIKTTNTGDAQEGSIAINGGSIAIDAGADGIYAVRALAITGGALRVTAAADGLQADGALTIADGVIRLTTGGSSENAAARTEWENRPDPAADTTDTASAKGIKSSGLIVIGGGEIRIDSSDDAVHSNDSIVLSGGTLDLSSGDDGVHADGELLISECALSIAKSYEGLEGSNMTISGGEIRIVSSDDGINISGGADGSSMNRPGANSFAASSGSLDITGGYLYINASGDGLDANGSIRQTGGSVLISGPTSSGNGALDFSSYTISGGLLIAAGSSGMAQAPDGTDEQPVVSVYFDSAQSAGTLVSIAGTGGLAFSPLKEFSSLIVSDSRFKSGQDYAVTVGGAVIGAGGDGLYLSAAENGTELYTFTMRAASSVGSRGGDPARGGRPVR